MAKKAPFHEAFLLGVLQKTDFGLGREGSAHEQP